MSSFIEFHTGKQTYIVSQSPESVKSVFQNHGALQEQLESTMPEEKSTSSLAVLARKILS